MNGLSPALKICAGGMAFYGTQMRIISENMANAHTVSESPGEDPYCRRVVLAEQHTDKSTGALMVGVRRIARDTAPFPREHRPSHPGADAGGWLKLTNVQPLVEMMDMRMVNHVYSSILEIFRQESSRIQRTVDILRA
jgi:flagellar basal-body rod protein FlgC